MCVCGSRGQGWPGWVAAGWATPPSFNAVRAATRWIRFSVMPSIWGRRVYDAALDGSGLCSEVPYGSSARVISVRYRRSTRPSLSYAIKSMPWHRNTCSPRCRTHISIHRTTPAQSETERPSCSPVCFRPLPTPKYNETATASETRNVWRYRVLLTGNFPSTINMPAMMMLVFDAHQQENQQVTRCHADVLQITRQRVCLCPRPLIAACVLSLEVQPRSSP